MSNDAGAETGIHPIIRGKLDLYHPPFPFWTDGFGNETCWRSAINKYNM
jgi:hypothetical protein